MAPSVSVAEFEGEALRWRSELRLAESTVPGAGMGVFARKDIPEDVAVTVYVGTESKGGSDGTYVFRFSETLDIDAERVKVVPPVLRRGKEYRFGRNMGRYINDFRHRGKIVANAASKNHRSPNCHFEGTRCGAYKGANGRVYYATPILTSRDILAGEELFLDYGDLYWTVERVPSARNK
jgi:hypothetical protein